MKIVSRCVALLLPLMTAGFLASVPPLAAAQAKVRYAPSISNFQIDVSDQLTAGSDIEFRLEGTPRGQASVRLNGVNKTINLRETERGIYEGSYTLSRRDRLGSQPTARATLRVRSVSAVATQALVDSTPPVAVKPSPPVAAVPPAAPPSPLAVERFTVAPVARIEPGAELRFAVIGTPGARASFTIDGVVRDIAMQETRPGRYEGAYTIRRNDNFLPSINIVSTLQANGQVVRSQLNQALLVDARPPTVRNLAPHDKEIVVGSPVSVSATFDDRGGVGVDPKSVKIMIGGQDMTRNASITPQFLTWRGDLRPGTYPVELTAADSAGNAVRQDWVFTVAGAQAAPSVVVLPLQITSHANNAEVASGTIEVRGRTAPDAKVDIQVQAIASVAGFFGINQQVANQSLRADGSGNFAFSFQPQVPVPGARYEVTITATRGDLNRETKLVLFQQR